MSRPSRIGRFTVPHQSHLPMRYAHQPTRRKHAAVAFAALLACLALPWKALAQPVDMPVEAPAAAAPDGAPPAAKPAGPDTTIWLDDNGVSRPVVGLSYEDLMKAWRLLEGIDRTEDSPRFDRQAIVATGVLKDDRVELTVRYDVVLPAGGGVATPLGFAGAVLSGPPVIESAGDSQSKEGDREAPPGQFVAYEAERGGFVAWINGEPDARRTITLPLVIPLERDNSQVVLRANIPRATQSTLILDSPNRLPDPFVSEGAVLDRLPGARGGGRIVVQGARGDFQLGWRARTTDQSNERMTVLSAEGRVFCEIDGRRVRSRAELKVTSYGGPVERFRVRLPAGSTLIPTTASEEGPTQPRVSLLESEPGDATDARPVCLVQLPQATTSPATVVIESEQVVGLGDASEIDLAGFDVVDAVRQDGEVALRVAEDRRIRWGELGVAQRVDVAELSEELRLPGVTAGVKYFAQPWKLPVRIVRLATRIEALPSYTLLIKPDQAVLTTRIDYRIPGARVSSFAVDLKGWTLAPAPPIGPAELVDSSRLSEDEYELTIPLLRPTSQQAHIEFTAVTNLDPTSRELSFELPNARATTQGVSELIVVADPAVQLIPDLQQSERLRAEPLTEDRRVESDPTGMRTFRFVGFLPDQVFVAEKRNRPGETRVAIQSRVDLLDSEARVEQIFDYEALYESVSHVRLAAPSEMVEASSLEFELFPMSSPDTAAAIPLSYTPGPPPEADDRRTEVRVELPRPFIGKFRIVARLSEEGGLRALSLFESTAATLLTPLGASQVSHSAVVDTGSQVPVALGANGGGWVAEPTPASGEGLAANTQRTAKEITVVRQREIAPVVSEAVLRREWRQTWVGVQGSQQRDVFVFDTPSGAATLLLPEDLSASPVEVYLDRKPVAKFLRSANKIIVPLDGSPVGRRTLELRYFRPAPPVTGELEWSPAKLESDATYCEGYWEVILPSGRQVRGDPAGFASAMHWSFESGVWGQRPNLTGAELEQWAGAVERGRPADGEYRYLYSYLGPAPAAEGASLKTISRPLIVLANSAIVLFLGLGLIYSPQLRRPAGLFALAVIAIGAGAAYPAHFMFLVQTGSLGIFLAVFAGLLAAVLRSPDLGEVTIGPTSLATPAGGPGTDTLISLPMGGASGSAQTVSMPPNDSRGSAN